MKLHLNLKKLHIPQKPKALTPRAHLVGLSSLGCTPRKNLNAGIAPLKPSFTFRSMKSMPLSSKSTQILIQASDSTLQLEGVVVEDLILLYKAKCKDLDIVYTKDQESRFVNFCTNSFKKRVMDLRSNGLGSESSKILSQMMKKNIYYSELNISNNKLGDFGAKKLGKALSKSKLCNFIHLDLNSNGITSEGCSILLDSLCLNETLISIDLSTQQRTSKNRLGIKGSQALGRLLATNSILCYIKIAGTSLGKEGLDFIIKGLAKNQTIVHLDLAENGIDCRNIHELCESVVKSKLKELSLGFNDIGNKGCGYISKMLMGLYETSCSVVKLDISRCNITKNGFYKIFTALENNAVLKELNLEGNLAGPSPGSDISKCISVNGTIVLLNLNGCDLRDDGIIKISEGLGKNISIKKLGLSKNSISDASAKHLSEALAKNHALSTLDLSSNLIKNIGGALIASALKKNKTIQCILLNENSMRDEVGPLFVEVSKFMTNIFKINLDLNPINNRYIHEIDKNLARNKLQSLNSQSPKIAKALEKLSITTEEIDGLLQKINGKVKEKNDMKKKIEKQMTKLNIAQNEEVEKFKEVKIEKNEISERNQELTKEMDGVFFELTKMKLKNEQEIRELKEFIAKTDGDIKSLGRKGKGYVGKVAKDNYMHKKHRYDGILNELKEELSGVEAEKMNNKQLADEFKTQLQDIRLELNLIRNSINIDGRSSKSKQKKVWRKQKSKMKFLNEESKGEKIMYR